MKIVLYYFSGTGNTWFVANNLVKALTKKGGLVEIHNIEEIRITKSTPESMEISQADKVIIGYPIYGSKAPRIMEEFLNNLPNGKGKSINIFTTVALFSGDGPIAYKSLLMRKGYTFETAMEFIMNNNFNVPGFPDALHVGDENKINKRHQKVLPKITKMAEMIITGQKLVQGKSIAHRADRSY